MFASHKNCIAMTNEDVCDLLSNCQLLGNSKTQSSKEAVGNFAEREISAKESNVADAQMSLSDFWLVTHWAGGSIQSFELV